MPLENNIKKNGKAFESKLKAEKNRLISETKEHIKNKNHFAAEKTYYQLEEANNNEIYPSRIERIYDKIINLYYRKKIYSEKEFGSAISSQINSDAIEEDKKLAVKKNKRKLFITKRKR